MRLKPTLVLIAIAAIATACSKQSDFYGSQSTIDSEASPQIISDRPINQNKVIFTVKLSTPALVEAAKATPQGLVVPPEAIQAVDQEQNEVISQLKKISPEITVLNRYRVIFNGLAFAGPSDVAAQLTQVASIKQIRRASLFSRPQIQEGPKTTSNKEPFKQTSVAFIEADRVHRELKDAKGEFVRGQGLRVGVIDTGIDYTHRMLGGTGRAEDFKGINPSEVAAAFPNNKVVGGIDLVGTAFDAGSEVFENQIPKPDKNPIDEAGHGTHVAGSIAGIGDGVETYSGVAPDATLYALKVFGANGSTSDFVVVAALEYAADPNGDGNIDDHLDVVNLSLGGGFGQPQILYTEAIRNLTKAGTVVVASAGNSGAIDYIVGAPSTADDALSVAASVDNMPHNWTFPAVAFAGPKEAQRMVRAIQGPISKPISETSASGKLVFIGLGDRPLTPDEAKALKGQVAFIDRGKVPFLQKLKLAEEAGAVGAVVGNNQPGDPIPMGGEGSVRIPAVMITKEVADSLKAEMSEGAVSVVFNTGKSIEDSRLIDTLTDFSSKGPRSQDNLLKPEIAGPGLNIISAAMGEGDKGVALSGTSMSGPHLAGVMTLLKQAHPALSVKALKSLAMSTAVSIKNEAGHTYPLSMQGAGRVRTYAAATAALTLEPAALSLGHLAVSEAKTLRRQLTLTNISSQNLEFTLSAESSDFLQLRVPSSVQIAAGQSKTVDVLLTVRATPKDQAITELNARVIISTNDGKQQTVPVIAVVTKISSIAADSLKVHAASAIDAPGSLAELTLTNSGTQPGQALAFNLIAKDKRKARPQVTDSFRSRSCDLESAGYRIVRKFVDGENQDMLQVAVKLYEPTTTWHYCEVSVQIDSDQDQLADQELVGIAQRNLSGLGSLEFNSILLDAVKARSIRMAYEEQLAKGEEAPLSYGEAIVDVQPMRLYNQSTVAVIEAPLKMIKLRDTGELAVKVATLYADSDGFEADDFLGGQLNHWAKLGSRPTDPAYGDIPEVIELEPGQSLSVPLTRGGGREKLVVYAPTNAPARTIMDDPQAMIVKETYMDAQSLTSRK